MTSELAEMLDKLKAHSGSIPIGGGFARCEDPNIVEIRQAVIMLIEKTITAEPDNSALNRAV